jgi:hypothetical protein
MKKIKELLLDIYLIINTPFNILFAIVWVCSRIKDEGLLGFTMNGFDEDSLDKFTDRHYPLIFRKILAFVLWFNYFVFVLN